MPETIPGQPSPPASTPHGRGPSSTPATAPTGTAPAVEAVGVHKAYRGRPALLGIDLQAGHGRVTALLGPNGAGKSTLVECCEGLRTPDAGTVRVLGHDPARAGAAHRARVGAMLQDGGLPPAARTGEFLRHVAALHDTAEDPAALLAELGLAPHARTVVRRLSGGLRQRLALATALVGRPEVLFLDEPTTGLDPQARLAVWDVVRAARDRGAAVVLTTHAMDEAELLADHVVVVDHGRVVTEGSVGDLLGRAARPGLRVRLAPGTRADAAQAADLAARLGPPQGTAHRADAEDAPPAAPVEVQVGEGGTVVDVGHLPGGDGVAGPRVLRALAGWSERHALPVVGVDAADGSGTARPGDRLEALFLSLTGRSLR